MTRTKAVLTGAIAALAIGATGFVAFANDRGERRHGGMHDMMRGGGPMMMGRICAEKDSMAPRMIERLEKRIQPTDAQKPDVEALKTAAVKAEATMKAACPTQAERDDRSPPARLALAEKRMSAALEAIKTIRPPFDALYAKLDDKQRDSLRWMRHKG
jgi:hypothetical protein